jgi:hypothetical protein
MCNLVSKVHLRVIAHFLLVCLNLPRLAKYVLVEKFDWDVIAGRTFEVYQEAVEEG